MIFTQSPWILVLFCHLFCLQQDLTGLDQKDGWTEVAGDQTWCGIRSLWLIARHHELGVTFAEMRSMCPDHLEGHTSLETIEQVAARLNLHTSLVECDHLQLTSHLPCLVVMEGVSEKAAHAQVLLGIKDNEVSIIDPHNFASVVHVPLAEFATHWTGIAMLVSKDPIVLPRSSVAMYAAFAVASTFFAWLVFARRRRKALGALLLCLLLLGCRGDSPAAEMLSIADPSVNVGRQNESARVTHQFMLQNKSDSAITILGVRPACSCVSSNDETVTIAVGGRHEVTLNVDLRTRRGVFTTGAVVLYCAEGEPDAIYTQELKITSVVCPDFSVTPGEISFPETSLGSSSKKSLKILEFRDTGTAVPSISIDCPNAEISTHVTHEQIRDRGNYLVYEAEVDLIWKPQKALSRLSGTVVLKTNQTTRVALSGKSVHPHIEVSPSMLVLRGKNETQFTCVLKNKLPLERLDIAEVLFDVPVELNLSHESNCYLVSVPSATDTGLRGSVTFEVRSADAAHAITVPVLVLP